MSIFPQSAISLKAGHLVQVQLWNRSEATIVREVKDKNMIVVRVCLTIAC